MIYLTKNNNFIQIPPINFYSYIVGVMCIIMILINIWYCKEILKKVNFEESKAKLLLKNFYIIGILFVSFI